MNFHAELTRFVAIWGTKSSMVLLSWLFLPSHVDIFWKRRLILLQRWEWEITSSYHGKLADQDALEYIHSQPHSKGLLRLSDATRSNVDVENFPSLRAPPSVVFVALVTTRSQLDHGNDIVFGYLRHSWTLEMNRRVSEKLSALIALCARSSLWSRRKCKITIFCLNQIRKNVPQWNMAVYVTA